MPLVFHNSFFSDPSDGRISYSWQGLGDTELHVYFTHDFIDLIQITLLVNADTEDFDDEQLEELISSFEELFYECRNQMAMELGEPNYFGTCSDPDFPFETIRLIMTAWNTNSARLVLAVENLDRETPVILNIDVEPLSNGSHLSSVAAE